MTLFPFPRRPLDIDEEGRRASEALRKVMAVRRDAAPSAEWRQWEGRRRRRRVRRSLLTVALVLGAAALGTAGWFGGRLAFAWVRDDTGWLRIQKVEVAGLDRLTEAEVLGAAGIRVGEYWFDADPDSAARRLSGVPLVKAATVRRTWKREIRIDITERRPIALALIDRSVEIDEEGVVLPLDPSGYVTDLPIVLGLEGTVPEPGERLVDPAAQAAARLAARLASPNVNLADRVSEIRAGEADSLVLVLMENAVPVKVGKGDIPERRLQALSAVLADLAEREVDVEYLDLRFAQQVVVKPIPEETETKVEPEPASPALAKPAISKPAPKRTPAKKPGKGAPGKAGNKGRRSHGRHT
jgi:cell division protein FtsQ